MDWEIFGMKIDLDYEASVVNKGNLARLKKVISRAKAGESLRIGFIGGSITQRFNASIPENCYAYRVYQWWVNTFPSTEFQYINAGIGATDSQFGCARAESDLLQYNPDFVIIEFSVNEGNDEHVKETYEGLVRKVLKQDNKPAVLLVHNVFYDTGLNAQPTHLEVGRYYELPAVSMQTSLYKLVEAGVLSNFDVTTDNLHPNDLGHEYVADIISHFLKTVVEIADIKEEMSVIPETTLTKNRYENSVRYQNNSNIWNTEGFQIDTEKQEHITDIFKNGWTASTLGEKIMFHVLGNTISVQYRKTICKPAPKATVTIDGDKTFILDANFDETWGDLLKLDTLIEEDITKEHQVEIEITETHEDDKTPFYLVSIIATK